MDDSTKHQLIFEAHRKSTGVSYLLWFFLGFLGAHRFYLGRTGTGILQLLMCLSIVGIIPLAFWWLIDAFRIPDLIREADIATIHKLEGQPERPPPRLEHDRARPLDPRVEAVREMGRSRFRRLRGRS